jgi:hypothetical protein
MFTAHDDADLAALSPSRTALRTLKATLLKWAPYLILTGLVLFGLLFPVI